MGLFKKLFAEDDPKHRKRASEGHEPNDTSGIESPGPDLSGPWTGVDLDGTLAVWDHTASLDRIGPPVPEMLAFVKRMVDNDIRVKIFTARAGDPDQIPKVREWLKKHGLPPLEITNVKDYHMERLYDDRCVQVEANTGRIISDIY